MLNLLQQLYGLTTFYCDKGIKKTAIQIKYAIADAYNSDHITASHISYKMVYPSCSQLRDDKYFPKVTKEFVKSKKKRRMYVNVMSVYIYIYEGHSKSNASYFIMLAHDVRGGRWWYGSRG
jgi:hypothetical protein